MSGFASIQTDTITGKFSRTHAGRVENLTVRPKVLLLLEETLRIGEEVLTRLHPFTNVDAAFMDEGDLYLPLGMVHYPKSSNLKGNCRSIIPAGTSFSWPIGYSLISLEGVAYVEGRWFRIKCQNEMAHDGKNRLRIFRETEILGITC